MSQFSAICFDLDNTLFDHHYSSQIGLAALQSQYPAMQAYSLHELEKIYFDFLNRNYDHVLAGKLSMEAARQERMVHYLAHFDITVNEAEAASAVSLYRHHYEANQRTVPGTTEVLAALYGRYQLAVITNGLVFYQYQKLGKLNLRQYFDHVFISEAVGCKKPDAGIFTTALQQLHVSPETAVMVGDSWQSDIIGSTQVGLTAVWLNRSNEAKPATKNVYEIQNLSDLITTIGGN